MYLPIGEQPKEYVLTALPYNRCEL